MSHIRNILHASDFSKASRRAFATALAMAHDDRTKLTLVHVVVPIVPVVPEQYLDPSTWERINTHARRWGQHQLAKLADRARKHGVNVAVLLMEGDPAAQIVGAARSKRADFVVVGTHGRRGVSKFFLGSVAERIVATAPCPVVTVRGT